MEKITVKSKRIKRTGLLIFAIALNCTSLWAKSPSHSELKGLVVKPKGTFFTAQENTYSLEIPGLASSDIQADLSQMPLGVKFISSKKEEYFDSENQRGTLIQFWFTFSDTGLTKLPPLVAKIKGRTYYLPFENVTVYENPNLISPLLTVEFKKPERLRSDKKSGELTYLAKQGEDIEYQVCLQYFTQMLNYSWTLPKDSIFTETKRHEVQGSREFSPDKVPVADFVWKPLKPGKFELPSVLIEAVSYNGNRRQLSLPDITVSVEKSGNGISADGKGSLQVKNSAMFRDAFTEQAEDFDFAHEKYVPTIEDCKKLAELRGRELHSFFWDKSARRERIEFEQKIGLSDTENEPLKLFSGIFSSKYGIFAGGKVSPVPEENSSGYETSSGQRVRLAEKAGEWIYIKSKDVSGWVKSQQVIEID